MAGFDINEGLTPIQDPRGSGAFGAILFDQAQLRQVDPRWFDPEQWGDRAQRIGGSGRGGAWTITGASYGACVLRQYLRGGMMAHLTRESHLWRGADKVRSFAEYRLLRELQAKRLPVPTPIAACYLRKGLRYRAWILLGQIMNVRSLAERAGLTPEDQTLWTRTGQLIARFHRVGLDHADLNAHNILFDADHTGWLIDFDRSRIRIPDTDWRQRNLDRLARSLRKLHGKRHRAAIEAGFTQLLDAYDAWWARGM